LADWLGDAHRLLVQPLVATFPARRRQLVLNWTTRDSSRHSGHDYHEERWHRLLDRVRAGELLALSFVMYQLEADRQISHTLPPIRFEAELTGLEYEGAAHRVAFGAGRPLYGASLRAGDQELVARMAKRAAVELQAAYGYITVDYAGLESPYELSISRTSFWGLKECAEFVRGYYWGNFLSAQHIERLGGLDRIQREAPRVLVEALENEPLLVYLQLTEDLDSFDDAELRRLRDFLLPLLPQIERPQSDTVLPLRIVPS
jgi:hypothetical protein